VFTVKSTIIHDKKIIKELSEIKYALDQSLILAITDRTGRITAVNDKFCEISKYKKYELIGQTHRLISSGYHSQKFFKDMWDTISNGEVWQGEIKNKAKDGSIYWVDTNIVPFLDEGRRPYQYVAIRNDITLKKQLETELRESKERFKKLAYHDELTSLPNRLKFIESLHLHIKNETPIAVLFLDLDRFKRMNDMFGHSFGDQILIRVAERMARIHRPNIIVSRQGGDEFTCIYPFTDYQDIVSFANEILDTLSKPITIKDKEVYVAPSIGISVYPENSQSVEELIKQADIAMYTAKQKGGNQFYFYNQLQEQNMITKREMETSLRRAIDKQEF
jgi:diguanylate cyclase (GGDEF)-like protein/PAS domain S-box-containing protein